jgi:hypothetical protein
MQYGAGAEEETAQMHELYPREDRLMVQQELAKASSAPVRLGDLDFGADEFHEGAPLAEFRGGHNADRPSSSDSQTNGVTSFETEVPWLGFEQQGDDQCTYEQGVATWPSEAQQAPGLEHSTVPNLPDQRLNSGICAAGSFFQQFPQEGLLSTRPATDSFQMQPQYQQPQPQPQPQQQQQQQQHQQQQQRHLYQAQQQLQLQPVQNVFRQHAAPSQSSREQYLDMTSFVSQFSYVEPVPKPEMHGASEVWIARDSEE